LLYVRYHCGKATRPSFQPIARKCGTIASENGPEEITMKEKKAFVVLAVTTALSFLSCASAVAKDDMGDMGDRRDRGGSVVVRCSLSESSSPPRDFRQSRRRRVIWFCPIAEWRLAGAAQLSSLIGRTVGARKPHRRTVALMCYCVASGQKKEPQRTLRGFGDLRGAGGLKA
jgi:hypothetical protein